MVFTLHPPTGTGVIQGKYHLELLQFNLVIYITSGTLIIFCYNIRDGNGRTGIVPKMLGRSCAVIRGDPGYLLGI